MYVCVPNNATNTKFVCRERVHYDENMTLRKNFYVYDTYHNAKCAFKIIYFIYYCVCKFTTTHDTLSCVPLCNDSFTISSAASFTTR